MTTGSYSSNSASVNPRMAPCRVLHLSPSLHVANALYTQTSSHITQHVPACICPSMSAPLQGDLVLRDGEYVSEHDTFMKVEGVYIVATGRLQAVLTPVHKVQVSLEQEDLDLHTADYR